MSVHLLTGDDESILRSKAHDLINHLVGDDDRSLLVDEFDGEDYELRSVVDAAQTMPFLTDRRIVIARDVGRFGADEFGPLLGYLADPLDTTQLVLIAGGGRLPKKLVDGVSGGRGTRHRHQPAPQGQRPDGVDPGRGRAPRRARRCPGGGPHRRATR